MRRVKWFLIALVLCTLSGGEVYWRTPRDRAPLTELLPGLERVLYHTPAEINGHPVELEVSKIAVNFSEIQRILAQWRTPHQLTVIGDTIRFRRFLPGDRVEHLLLIFSGDKPVVAFRMETPRQLPAPVWPAELPALPAGATAVQVVKLGKSGGVLGEFRHAPNSPSNLKRQLESELRSRGFRPADRDPYQTERAGGIYLKLRPKRQLAWLSFDAQGNGAVYCSSER